MVAKSYDESIDIDNVPENMCVAYGPDMFYQSRILLQRTIMLLQRLTITRPF